MKENVPPPEILDQVEERAKIDSNVQTFAHLQRKHLQDVKPIIAGLPTDRGVLIEQTRFFLAQTGIAFIEVGRRLIALKEITEHGDWLTLLTELNIGLRTARYAMKAAAKFGSVAEMLHLDPSKYIAILDAAGDADIKSEVEEHGTVCGIGIDAIDAMTNRQLREKFKTSRLENAAMKRQMERGAEQLRTRDQQIRDLKIGPKTDLEFMQRCQEIQQSAIPAPAQLRVMIAQVRTHSQAAALIATALYLEKQIVLVSEEIQRTLDATYDGSDAGMAVLESKPDGINWFELSVFAFLEEATRKANGTPEEIDESDISDGSDPARRGTSETSARADGKPQRPQRKSPRGCEHFVPLPAHLGGGPLKENICAHVQGPCEEKLCCKNCGNTDNCNSRCTYADEGKS